MKAQVTSWPKARLPPHCCGAIGRLPWLSFLVLSAADAHLDLSADGPALREVCTQAEDSEAKDPGGVRNDCRKHQGAAQV